MHPSHWARIHPNKPAIIMANSGQFLTYFDLDANSSRAARLLRSRGLGRGDNIALFMGNDLRFMEICWGAQRSGLYFTPVSWHSTPAELEYILVNSGARALFTSQAFENTARQVCKKVGISNLFVVGGASDPDSFYEVCISQQRPIAIEDESPGREMLYSSGSTGRPKGIKQPLPETGLSFMQPAMAWLTERYFFDTDTVNLTPAPLYHAGPLRYSLCVGHTGGTNIIMEKFDAERSLELISRYQVTHTEMVPTMLVRLGKLDSDVRGAYDLGSLRLLAHGTGPCPPETKKELIDWLGEIVEEQYGGTEGNGLCAIDSTEWIAHPGSVGKAVIGKLHIVSPEGNECECYQNGLVYFEGGPKFEYHGEPGKTAGAYMRENWSTLGDIGYVDEEGYLYLTDRQSDMIISGGVNIYPREVENVIIRHPEVVDVAVVGMPHDDLGQQVVAIVQPCSVEFDEDLGQRLSTFCRQNLSRIKCPKKIKVVPEMPRLASGKIVKAKLQEQYLNEFA
jgi:acyl-CoA synthetase (AMP-forming)/AMP-acid ligase II